jgi:hypothetical protein
MKGSQNVIYLIFAVGMLIYAIPQLHVGHGFRMETLFAAVWLGLALIVIASHLYVILKVEQGVELEMKNQKPMKSSDY